MLKKIVFDPSEMKQSKKSITLILSTGGIKGVWQASVIDVLIREGIFEEFDVDIIGGSAGAINTLLMRRLMNSRSGITLSEIWKDAVLPTYQEAYKRSKKPFNVIKSLISGSSGLLDTDELFASIDQKLITLRLPSLQKPMIMGSRKREINFMVASYDMRNSRVIVVGDKDPRFEIVALASAAIPVAMKPVTLSDSLLTDIGVVDPLLYYTVFKSGVVKAPSRSNTFAVVAQKTELNGSRFDDKVNLLSIGTHASESLLDSLIYHQFLALEQRVNYISSFNDQFGHDLLADDQAIDALIVEGSADGLELVQRIKSIG